MIRNARSSRPWRMRFTRRDTEFVYFADRFVALIRNHIRKEDTILFDVVDRLLSPEQDEKVVLELRKFATKPEWFVDLRRLEWKYVRKPVQAVYNRPAVAVSRSARS